MAKAQEVVQHQVGAGLVVVEDGVEGRGVVVPAQDNDRCVQRESLDPLGRHLGGDGDDPVHLPVDQGFEDLLRQ